MARENSEWGYVRIQGALANLGYAISSTTVAKVLNRHGIEPAPERQKHTTWSTFLKSHWELLAATDFFTIEVWTMRGLVTYYVLFTIHLASRRVHVAGITTSPNSAFMIQVARQLTDEFDGALNDVRFLIMDRDKKFTNQFKALLRQEGVEPVPYPPRSPNCSPYAERFVRSIKAECLDRIIPIGVGSLRRAINEYAAHYHGERNHQGLDNRLIDPSATATPKLEGFINRRERLGGLLNYYYRLAA
ncbi:MAG: integrase core domain-containing protein [Candidatus Krumholzibacteria bacterium]|nr:integrase core domain-containing protein [Candidatus Krumholzibacteria bacterium]